MTEKDKDQINNIFSNNDTLDINELASLNDDFSADFIEQLQNKIAQNANEFTGREFAVENSDAELFEEINATEQTENITASSSQDTTETIILNKEPSEGNNAEEAVITNVTATLEKEVENNKEKAEVDKKTPIDINVDKEIENLTGGNIIEKPATEKAIAYNESLDYLDENIKYSKYVIYINPENKDFIESLTVKERKNLINRILREQDDIAITKKRLNLIQTIVKHAIISIITIAITIPVVYWTINTSLEATIDNYRRSKTVFSTLYKEKGKIRTQGSN